MPAPISPNLFNTLPSAATSAPRPQSSEATADPRGAAQQPSFRESLNQVRQKRRDAAASSEHGARTSKPARSAGAKRAGAKKHGGAKSGDAPTEAKESEPVVQDAAPNGEVHEADAQQGHAAPAAEDANQQTSEVAEGEDAGADAVEGSADPKTVATPAGAGNTTGVTESPPTNAAEDREADRADHEAAPDLATDPTALAAAVQGAEGAAAAAPPTVQANGGDHPSSEATDDTTPAGQQGAKAAVTPLAAGPRQQSGRSTAQARSTAGPGGNGAEQQQAGATTPTAPAAAAPASAEAAAPTADEAPPASADPATAGAPAPAPATGTLSHFASQLADAAAGSSPSHATTDPLAGDAPDAPAPPEVRFASTNHPSIVRSIRQELLPNGGTMRLRLDPAELGAIQVTVRMQDGAMTASFETSSDHATSLLSHSLGQLKAALESQGVQVDRLHVQQSPREQSASQQQQQGGEQHRDGNPHDHPARQEQQRRELLRRMWQRMSGGQDPLDLVA